MDHAIRAATEQAPATVEGLMSLVRAYGLASEHRHDRKTFDAVRDLASRLAAPPAPPQEPVAWVVYVQAAARGWWADQIYKSLETARGYSNKRKQIGEVAFVSPLYASPPPSEPQEVELLTDEEVQEVLKPLSVWNRSGGAAAIQRAFAKKAGLRVKEGE